MKKLFFLLPFMVFLCVATANAQSCSSSASAGKSCCANKAAKAAAADTNIEKRMADDGSVSYVRKETDAQGSVRFVSVQFDETSNTFVNVAPKSIAADDKAGMVKKSASCSGEKKACCAGGEKAATKACCSSKSASAPVEQ